MLEIHLQLDSHYSPHVMGKEINLDKIGIQKNYSMTSESIKLLFEIIAHNLDTILVLILLANITYLILKSMYA